ncbi:hypothetical protein MTX20_26520 [Bradyrhizobium sp. ISRA435]|nr:hypothetical protein MTX20_26520 [Bradyrhizobium sp. ISRA435]
MINPKTGEMKAASVLLTRHQFVQAKRSRLDPEAFRSLLPAGFMFCDESFGTP